MMGDLKLRQLLMIRVKGGGGGVEGGGVVKLFKLMVIILINFPILQAPK